MKTILAAIDDVDNISVDAPMMQRTLELARAFSGKVWLMHVVPRTREPAPFNIDDETLRDGAATELRKEHELLQMLARCLRDRGVDAQALLIEGATVRTLLKESERLDADLIVLGCRRHGTPYGVLLEFTEEGMLGKCARPILYVPTQ